jgi:hypothetical protein
MVVTSDQPVVAERVLYFGEGEGSGKFGATALAGLSTPASQFLFTGGSRPGADAANATAANQTANDESYLTIVNPNPGTGHAMVTAWFTDTNGASLGSQTIPVAAGTRSTIVVNDIIKPVKGPYAVGVSSTQPIFVEQPQYFGGSPNVGRHPGVTAAGAPGGAGTVLFPSVATAAADGTPMSQTVFLLNTGSSPVSVTGTYYASSGRTAAVSYTVGAGRTLTVDVNADTAGLPHGALGAQYTAGAGSLVALRIGNTADRLAYTSAEGIPVP